MQTALANNSTASTVVALKSLTELNKALGDSLRLQILRLLKNESFGVLELCRILDIRQSALSHHLKILATAQLVSTRREGNSIFYRRTFLADEDPYREIKESVFGQVDELAIAMSTQKKISLIQSERAQQSLNFFNKNANKFHEQQGLIVAHDEYGPVLHDVIESLSLTEKARVLEVGPGEGQLLVKLAAKFGKLIALDNSEEMLEKSRHAVNAANFRDVEFILGDTAVARKKNVISDLIIFDMVLHHISSPAKTFRDAAALLKEKGQLLIAELSTHDQDWVRESCGDLWLGFDESDLNHWAKKAGLKAGQSSYLSLRNGFQIQIWVFTK